MRALKKVEAFDGSGDVERWIDRMEMAIELDEEENKAAVIFSMNLSGSAYDTWKGLSDVERKDVDEIKKALRRVYGLRATDAWQSVLLKRTIGGDNLDVCAEGIRKLVNVTTNDATDPTDRISAMIFYFSLPANIQEQVAMALGDRFSFEEVVRCAKAIWPSQADRLGAGGFTRTQKGNRMGYDRDTKRCTCCGRSGHTRSDCRVRCFGCGRQGHMKKDCDSPSAVPLNAEEGTSNRGDVPKLHRL